MATVSRGETLHLRFSAEAPQDLHLLHYELDKASIDAEFAAGPVEPGHKSGEDLISILVVAVATLAEARRLIGVLVDARVRLAKTVRATVDEIEVTNADSTEIEKIIEGHFDKDRRQLGNGPSGD